MLAVVTIAIWAALAIWVLRRALEPLETQLRRIADELELMDENLPDRL